MYITITNAIHLICDVFDCLFKLSTIKHHRKIFDQIHVFDNNIVHISENYFYVILRYIFDPLKTTI